MCRGSLICDDKEITKENIGGYLSKITAVFQFSHLFRRTIYENVAYGLGEVLVFIILIFLLVIALVLSYFSFGFCFSHFFFFMFRKL